MRRLLPRYPATVSEGERLTRHERDLCRTKKAFVREVGSPFVMFGTAVKATEGQMGERAGHQVGKDQAEEWEEASIAVLVMEGLTEYPVRI